MDSGEKKASEEEVGQSGKATWKLEILVLNPEMCLEIHMRLGRKCPWLRELVLMALKRYLEGLPFLTLGI